MRKLLGQFVLVWVVLILTFITGAILIFFVEILGGIVWLVPLILFSLFILREIKNYADNSRPRDR
jgi:F0F1-type ATP synthase assembly protein I